MKKKALPLAVSAAAAVSMSAAQAAMYINEKGTGEALIYPFYSAENGNTTNINVVNTTTGYKAVKVRILEGENSQEVLDFNLYLSPKDHFSFSISQADDGAGMLKTGDNSCTAPGIPEEGVKFRTYLFKDDVGVDDPATAADESFTNNLPSRTASGYVEIIEMGQIDPSPVGTPVADSLDAVADPDYTLTVAAAMKHDSAGMPADCKMLQDAWRSFDGTVITTGKWKDDASSGDLGTTEMLADWAGGGLYGYATVINVPDGSAYGYDVVAIEDLLDDADVSNTGSIMHYEPGTVKPAFTDAAIDNDSIVIIDGASTELSFASYGAVDGLQALNSLMMTTTVMNDFVTDSGIGAETDWVLTFPTKTFHVTPNPAVEPFGVRWNKQTACEPSALTIVNREESQEDPPTLTGEDIDFSSSPPTPTTPSTPTSDVNLCFEASIVQFGSAEDSAVETDSLAIGVNALLGDDPDGWASLSLNPDDTVTVETNTRKITGTKADSSTVDFTGLPLVGFAVQKYVNESVGAGANYAMSTEHKTMTVTS
jgi:hypothetical protein